MRKWCYVIAGVLALLSGFVMAGAFVPTASIGVLCGVTTLCSALLLALFVVTINVAFRDAAAETLEGHKEQ